MFLAERSTVSQHSIPEAVSNVSDTSSVISNFDVPPGYEHPPSYEEAVNENHYSAWRLNDTISP